MSASHPVTPGASLSVVNWRLLGACNYADADLFFGPEGEAPQAKAARESAAKAVCARCPVRDQCLGHAMASGVAWGVWGGTGEEERRVIRARAGLPVLCGNGLHWMTPENTKHVAGTGRVRCRECQRDSDRRTRNARHARRRQRVRDQREGKAA